MVERAIVALLEAADTLAGDRIWPLHLDRDPSLPAITYQRISTPRPIAHDGDQGYADFRTQLNCWASRADGAGGFAQARQLADQVRRTLNGWRGVVAGVEVGMLRVSGDRDERDPERVMERIILEVSGNYREA